MVLQFWGYGTVSTALKFRDCRTIMLLSTSPLVMGRLKGLLTPDTLHVDVFTPDALPYALHRSSSECPMQGVCVKFITHDLSALSCWNVTSNVVGLMIEHMASYPVRCWMSTNWKVSICACSLYVCINWMPQLMQSAYPSLFFLRFFYTRSGMARYGMASHVSTFMPDAFTYALLCTTTHGAM